ncbi:Ni/Fe hydrogenase subunit alpha [Patescibacteria group bacterium]|nr:Ni/Fe hydrogenase subunit alpha [Patescibacteria group bacterium]MBU1890400.1 Ni/Fe hydrogenase subunit alpha [Patescibacteria group bacterium]
MKITIKHIAQIEGHGGFVANLEKGKVKSAQIKTHEGARLIEALLVGRYYDEAPLITARICGVCPVVHNLCSIKALENALGVKVSPQTIVLREVMELGQTIQSHALHAYFMALGDYFDIKHGFDLMKRFPVATLKALKIRDFGNRLIQKIGGRSIHPLRTKVGGFTKLISQEQINTILQEIPEVISNVGDLVEVYKKIKFPKFHRPTEYYALINNNHYTFYQGDTIKSNHPERIPVSRFQHDITEIQRPYEMSKRAYWKGQSFFVGALARLHLNEKKLNPKAKSVLKYLPPRPIDNSFYNIYAQLIEILHSLEEAQKLLKPLAKKELRYPAVRYKLKAGKGVGAVEAPRGTLYHYYELDSNGYIVNCNIITPTVQMLSNLEKDLEVLLKGKKEGEATQNEIKKLVRSYDPCMTCATH